MNQSFIFIILFFSFTTQAQSVAKIDKLYAGQSLDEAKAAYPNATFKKVDSWTYCVDGESEGYVIEVDGTARFFVYSLYEDNSIANISILSSHNSIMDDNYVGMTFEKLLAKHPDIKLRIDDLCEHEYVYFPGTIALIFNTTEKNRIGIYDGGPGSYELVGYSEDLSKKVDRIRL